jgi:hypothetical protein
VTDLANALSSAGASAGGGSPGSGSAGGGSAGGGSSAAGSGSAPGGSTVKPGGGTTTVAKKRTAPKVTTHGGTLKLVKVSRSAHAVKMELTCTASKGRACTGNVGVSESGYTSQTRKVSLGGSAKKTWSFTLKAKKAKKAARAKSKRRPALRLIVHSGSYRYNHLLR